MKPAFEDTQPLGKPAFEDTSPIDSQPSWKSNLSAVARPVLEVGGAMGGSALGGGPETPVGIAGGVVGYGAGKAGADFLDTQLGLKQPIQNLGQAVGETGSDVVSGMGNEVMGKVLQPVLGLAGKGISKAVGLGKDVAEAVLPGVFKGTASIPEKATQMVISDPQILKQYEGTPEAIQGRVQNIQSAFMQAKQKVGQVLGQAFQKYAGMGNPIGDFIEGSTPPAQSIDQLRASYAAAKSGDLFEIPNNAGGADPMSNQEKLGVLTNLKREIQSHINFNKAPITLQPIDSVKDAALKKMAADVDEVRTALPNGKKLAVVDNAWKNINDIYDTVQKDLADPGKAQDTLMRLLKGDQTWLTAGRMGQKVDAIKQVEKMTGQNILEPALKELTASIFNQNAGKGLLPTLLAGGEMGTAATALMLGHPLVALGAMGGATTASPKLVGMGLSGAANAASGVNALGKSLSDPLLSLGIAAGIKRK